MDTGLVRRAATTPRLPVPPTTTGRPASSGRRCSSQDTKNAPMSTWRIVGSALAAQRRSTWSALVDAGHQVPVGPALVPAPVSQSVSGSATSTGGTAASRSPHPPAGVKQASTTIPSGSASSTSPDQVCARCASTPSSHPRSGPPPRSRRRRPVQVSTTRPSPRPPRKVRPESSVSPSSMTPPGGTSRPARPAVGSGRAARRRGPR